MRNIRLRTGQIVSVRRINGFWIGFRVYTVKDLLLLLTDHFTSCAKNPRNNAISNESCVPVSPRHRLCPRLSVWPLIQRGWGTSLPGMTLTYHSIHALVRLYQQGGEKSRNVSDCSRFLYRYTKTGASKRPRALFFCVFLKTLPILRNQKIGSKAISAAMRHQYRRIIYKSAFLACHRIV